VRYKRCRYADLPPEVQKRFLENIPLWIKSLIEGWRVIATDRHVAIANRQDEWYIAERRA
jgi:hypothetical protein